MKKVGIAIIALMIAGCQASDEEIRADIAGKAMQDLNFAGLNYTVKKGIVDVSGHCASEKAFAKIQQTIKSIHVIKGVNYRIAITSVTLDTLTPVKLQVDSILAQYPQVIANVTPGSIIITGPVTNGQRQKLISELNKQHISLIKDSLSIQ